MTKQDKAFYNQRNTIIFTLILLFFSTQVMFNIIQEGIASIFPPAFVFIGFASVVLLLIVKQICPVLMMYLIVVLMYVYFFFLLLDSPYLVNYIFMWLGLIMSTMYQNYRIILIASAASTILTIYTFFYLHEEIFPNVVLEDLTYLILFGVFVSSFLLVFIKYSLRLWQDAVIAKEKLQYTLENTDISTWSLELKTGCIQLSNPLVCMRAIPEQFSIKQLTNYISSEQHTTVEQAYNSMKKGNRETIELKIVSQDRVFWFQCRGIPIMNNFGSVVRIEGVMLDVTKQKETEEHMKKLAYHDHLTGVANRLKLQHTFSLLKDINSHSIAVLFIDLNFFKHINDTYGHDIGDILLQKVAIHLKDQLREVDTLARIGGDEFVALLSNVTDEQAVAIMNRIHETLEKPFSVQNNLIPVSASIGVSMYTDEQQTLEQLIKQADKAMYEDKRS
ncbi:diguanylate cyclase [Bacillus sp. HMF5848]|uniref:GGDEF domain-containing protein n=1 Tax=Bacillus sp. HMF5848 TaxID=2495421 RepID=UPI000F7953E7|nr:GGDEF domain-containing protein [Bacillus sp. HMF5848]RSK28654.1 diguanylate cyclase [Bacillus sp. HMF5848]